MNSCTPWDLAGAGILMACLLFFFFSGMWAPRPRKEDDE